MDGEARLIVIDGSNIFLRSYFGLINSNFDQPTWGIHGCIEAIAGMVKKFKPTHVVIVFDAGRSSYRLALYPEYKANRPKSDRFDESDSAIEQLAATEILLRMFGFCVWEEPNIEGDDIIAAVVKQYRDLVPVLIISGDKDLRQLVGPGVEIFHPSLKATDEAYDEAALKSMYGISPERLPEIWALSGDKGDNIPGVPGVGEKRALGLINKYGDIYKVGLSDDPKIEGYRQQIYISLKLVTLNPSLSKFNLSLYDVQFKPTVPDTDEGHQLIAGLQEYDLNRIIAAWSGGSLWQERGKRIRDFHKN